MIVRRTVIFFIFIICAVLLSVIYTNTDSIFAREENVIKHSYFLNEPEDEDYTNANPFYIVKNSIDNGIAQSYVVDSKTANKVLSMLNARLVRTERVNGINVQCYYSDAIKTESIMGANIQLADRGSDVVIGFPLILGSF